MTDKKSSAGPRASTADFGYQPKEAKNVPARPSQPAQRGYQPTGTQKPASPPNKPPGGRPSK
jgi:hypothetical protein